LETTAKLKILQNIFGSYRQQNEEYKFYCPLCNHHKPKLSINLGKNVFKCWVCDYRGRDIYRLIRRYGDIGQCREWAKFNEKVDISEFEKILFQLDREEKEKTIDLPKDFLPLSTKEITFSSLPVRKYLKNRSISDADILKWKIGYCNSGMYKDRLIIPSFNSEGKVNFFVARNYINNWRKYMNPRVAKNNIVFNELYLDLSKEIIITEGVFDAIIAGNNSVPLMGSTLSEESRLFWEIVKNDTSVFVALDRDAEKKALAIVEKFLKYDVEVFKIDTGGYEDVAEMPRRIFNKRKEEAEFMSVEKYMIYKASTA